MRPRLARIHVADARCIGTLPIAVPELDIRRRVTGMLQDIADNTLGSPPSGMAIERIDLPSVRARSRTGNVRQWRMRWTV